MNSISVANPPSLVELDIETLDHQGRGIARLNGKAVFVENALPGEKVKVRIRKKHRRFLEAEVVDILTRSVERVEPFCEHFSQCGGCRLQHVPINKQRELKQNTLLEQLQHFAGIKPQEILIPLTGDDRHYRRKARFSVRYVLKRDEVLVGFHEKYSNFITDTRHCPVLDKSVSDQIQELRAMIRVLDAFQEIPQIEIAVGDAHDDYNTAIIVRHLKALNEHDRKLLQLFAEKQGFRLYLQAKAVGDLEQLWPLLPLPEMAYQIQEDKLTISFAPQDFIQVSAALNRCMIQTVIKHFELSREDRVLDLFSGLGNFTLPIAKRVAEVIGVEGESSMTDKAKKNALSNSVDNARFFTANLFAEQSSSTQSPWYFEKFTKILVDPPRAGAENIIKNIQRFSAARVIYVSCNPATLARDAKYLVEQGYTLSKAGIIDLFPHTMHVEAIAVFDRSNSW